jgi:hypothetical protein
MNVDGERHQARAGRSPLPLDSARTAFDWLVTGPPAKRTTASCSPGRRPATTTDTSHPTTSYTPAACHDTMPTRQQHGDSAPPASPQGLLEPCAGPTPPARF